MIEKSLVDRIGAYIGMLAAHQKERMAVRLLAEARAELTRLELDVEGLKRQCDELESVWRWQQLGDHDCNAPI